MNVVGQGYFYGVVVIYSLLVIGFWLYLFFFGVDFKDFEEQIWIGGNNDRVLIKYVLLIFGYNGFCYIECFQLVFGLSLVVGIGSFFGYGDDDEEFDCKCYCVKFGFGVFKGDFNYILIFGGDWQVVIKVVFQFVFGLLIFNEQFVVGGVISVCGYLVVENIVDDGYLFFQEWCMLFFGCFFGKCVGGYVIDWCFYVFVEGV